MTERRARSAPTSCSSCADPDGPRAAPGPVLHARRGRALGRGRGRAAVPAARVLASCAARADGTLRLPARGRRARARAGWPSCAPGDGLWLLGPLGQRLRAAARRPPRRCWSAAASASRRWRSGRTRSAPPAPSLLLGFRDAAHAEGAALLAGARVATDDGSVGHHGLVTDLLRGRARRDARARSTRAARRRCSRRCARCAPSAACPAQLALESGMACGYGACFGCVVPTRDGYVRAVRRRARCSTRRRSRAWSTRERRVLRHRARAPDRQRLGHVRRDRRAARVRRRAARALPVRRLRLQDDHARAAPGQPAAAAVGARRPG